MSKMMTRKEAIKELLELEKATKERAKVLRAYIRVLETQEGDTPDDE